MSYEDADTLEQEIKDLIGVHERGEEEAAYAGDRRSFERHKDVVDALNHVLTKVRQVSGLYA